MNRKEIINKITGFKINKPCFSMSAGFITLLIKGIISGLTSVVVFNMLFLGFNIECDFLLMRKIIFAVTFIFSLLQVNLLVVSIAYIFTAIKIFEYIKANGEVIKNGFMTIANQCYSVISESMNLPMADGFDKIMLDTYLTVNTVSGIIAVIIAMVMVLVVVRLSSKILYTIGISIVLAVISFFNCEINYKYIIVLFLCYGIFILMSICNINSIKLSVFSLIKRKGKYKLKSSMVYALQIGAIACVMTVIVIQGFNIFYNNEKFNAKFNNDYSENIRVTARDVALMKYAEYKKYSLPEDVSMGQLGYVAYVKPNVKVNEFKFISEPISEGKVYFKSFTGESYNYRYNGWTEAEDSNNVMVNALKNAGAGVKEYEIISNKDLEYLPYYSENITYNEDHKAVVTGYNYKNVTINDESYNEYVQNTFLQIDDENKAVIDKICSQQGFNQNDENLESKLKDYLVNNFTYSTEVEILPYGKDFVNYFLEETKTGNFMQYASVLTLIYRNLGIPARYVSGYAVEAEQTLAGHRVGTKTRTDVKQANMYSWVEIYNKNGGWQVIDIVPAFTLEELEEKYGGENENTYTPDTSLNSYFSTVDREKYSPQNMARVGGRIALKIVVIISIAVLAIPAFIIIIWLLYKYIRYKKADNSKKAYILLERLKKKFKIECTSYRELEEIINVKYGSERSKEIIDLGEKCIFSNKVGNEDIKILEKLIRG